MRAIGFGLEALGRSRVSRCQAQSLEPGVWSPGRRGAIEPRAHDFGVHYAAVPVSREEPKFGGLMLLCLAAWAVPGAGHIWQGRSFKGFAFMIAIPLMFAIGLAVHGCLFPFDFSDPLVGLAALAHVGIGLPYLLAKALSLGAGDVRAIGYEYGNAFLVVAGLLNLLVVIDAYDIALGRK